jgi:8-oxo-dGTP pyrophosphatase MutT (NUDIX family)
MKTYITVHAVAINNRDEYLALQRAEHRSSPGTWNWVTGYIKDRASAEEAALRELKEETSLEGKIIKTTKPFWIEVEDVRWVVIASLIKVDDISELKIDASESQNYKWIQDKDPIVEKFFPLKKTLQELDLFD